MIRQPQLTIGCAVYDDFFGLWPTFQALRLGEQPEVLKEIEFVIVDNSPAGPEATTTKSFVEGWLTNGTAGARYVPLGHPTGTSAPRHKLFQEARAEWVLCIDSHILVRPGTIARLLEYLRAHPNSKDILSGPLLYDNLVSVSTHWSDRWRSEMWGTWDTDPRGDPSSPLYSEEPFEIWGNGLGLFAARREVWLRLGGFNANFRGFGGEEGYIHEKFRQGGGRALCLPWLQWVHRFGRPKGVPYPLNLWNKVRNYVIGHHELGLSFDRLHKHFILRQEEDGSPRLGGDGKPVAPFPQQEWDLLMKSPANPPETPPFEGGKPSPSCGGCGGKPRQPMKAEITLEDLYQGAVMKPSDINEHCPKLRELANASAHVTVFGSWHNVSTIALLAGQPGKLVSYDPTVEPIAPDLQERRGKTEFVWQPGNSLTADIEETDLLFIDTVHKAEHFYAELTRLAPRVRRWIARHDTQIYGEHGDGGGPGLLPALRRFCKEHPEWSVVYHTQKNHGFTVLGRLKEDKPALPTSMRMAWNYFKASAQHLLTGAKLVEQEQAAARLDECSLCEQRANDRCSVCGCFLNEVPENSGVPGLQAGPGRAWWAEQVCPLGKWEEADRRFVASLPSAEGKP